MSPEQLREPYIEKETPPDTRDENPLSLLTPQLAPYILGKERAECALTRSLMGK